mmetsp:Transcript_45714/g.130490  ORF Transcript_45714/g.130490 Transcript_45714/m.130490 type:complete len:217 (-) Transcript_45714:705-1355(-)
MVGQRGRGGSGRDALAREPAPGRRQGAGRGPIRSGPRPPQRRLHPHSQDPHGAEQRGHPGQDDASRAIYTRLLPGGGLEDAGASGRPSLLGGQRRGRYRGLPGRQRRRRARGGALLQRRRELLQPCGRRVRRCHWPGGHRGSPGEQVCAWKLAAAPDLGGGRLLGPLRRLQRLDRGRAVERVHADHEAAPDHGDACLWRWPVRGVLFPNSSQVAVR